MGYRLNCFEALSALCRLVRSYQRHQKVRDYRFFVCAIVVATVHTTGLIELTVNVNRAYGTRSFPKWITVCEFKISQLCSFRKSFPNIKLCAISSAISRGAWDEESRHSFRVLLPQDCAVRLEVRPECFLAYCRQVCLNFGLIAISWRKWSSLARRNKLE